MPEKHTNTNTHTHKHAHTQTPTHTFVRHIVSVCVNNPVISNCCIISTHVGSHTNTRTFIHKKLLSWGVGTQCSSVSAVCVCVFFLLVSWLQMLFCWFSFPSHAADLLLMAWHVCERRAACQCTSHTHLTVATETSNGSPAPHLFNTFHFWGDVLVKSSQLSRFHFISVNVKYIVEQVDAY